jgi:hypothetical protein
VVNDKVEATVHPRHPGGYEVFCEHCGNIYSSLFYDVAERFAELHEDSTGHETDIQERTPTDG